MHDLLLLWRIGYIHRALRHHSLVIPLLLYAVECIGVRSLHILEACLAILECIVMLFNAAVLLRLTWERNMLSDYFAVSVSDWTASTLVECTEPVKVGVVVHYSSVELSLLLLQLPILLFLLTHLLHQLWLVLSLRLFAHHHVWLSTDSDRTLDQASSYRAFASAIYLVQIRLGLLRRHDHRIV